MLDAYKRLEANGVIGPYMKVDASGNVVIDPSGERSDCHLVKRPFVEYPKAIRKLRIVDGKETVITLVAHSKSEELKMVAEEGDDYSYRSPVEKERDQLAKDLSDQQKINGELASKLEALMQRVEQLAQAAPTPAKSAAPKMEMPKKA